MLRRSTLQDARDLAPLLRVEDLNEIQASAGGDPVDALIHGVYNSKFPVTCVKDGVPFAMAGIVPDDTGHYGFTWLLCSNEVKNNYRWFLRTFREWLPILSEGFVYLGNYTDARNVLHHRFIEWCGFKIIAKAKYGIESMLFLEFQKRV
mgnify:CR=1 FL=1